MGSSSSKPSNPAPHVWKGTPQPGVSQNLVEQLETSNETDISRQQAAELLVQQRVAAELKRLREQEIEALREVQQRLSAEPDLAEDQQQHQTSITRQQVAKQIDDLRSKLEERRQVRPLPESVEKARSEVVRCLREHDRRPLNCWQEVEAFKEEVRKLEKGWVDKVAS
ncbi:uncharacterized protein CTHT_0012250 [Thermochaetoides thermophila DSM 1495]|uniref:MICOS complex subunit mic19 n=1 Tax=Chaetomium thermophilum (strain DSM 1495 / CBS 144.50 / IMI 039719) TaxID=759272 RepID=G0S140_CHATD|nr:hypothetical protein CTHT_0012250 [Thermochaetoides thermophila DSM 1495]EGS22750.1 hypothetical protein CTHT_0012250 [Thermochaetoides thermophila DSM 1495]